jgi:hypothetical protein
MHDASVLSATSLVAKEPVRGSWWAHPAANEMYRAITEAEDHEDVEMVKLLGGKLTFVHRRLWPSLLAAVTERADWQTKNLPRSALGLMEKIEEMKSIRADALRELKKEIKQIEERLLVFVTTVHTESGRHEKVLESWDAWRKRVALKAQQPSPENGRAEIEQAAAEFAPLRLPWTLGRR